MIWCPCIDIHKKFVCLKVAMQCEGRISKCWDNPDEKAWWWLWQKQFMQMLSAHNCEGKEECAWHGHQLKRTGWHKTFCCEQGGGIEGTKSTLLLCCGYSAISIFERKFYTEKYFYVNETLFTFHSLILSVTIYPSLFLFSSLPPSLSCFFLSSFCLSIYLSIHLSVYLWIIIF